MKIAGVYKITNIITGDFYIGSSKDIKHRWANHKSPSRWKQLPNSKLYKAMASYGLDNFTLEIIEETDNLREREQYYIECLKPSYNNFWAKGWNTDRYKEYYEIHRDEKLAYSKAYNKAYSKANRDELLVKQRARFSRLCLYEGETLTLSALEHRFRRQGIANPYKEAQKYLL